MFPRYLQYLLTDFRQTFVTGVSWDTKHWCFLGHQTLSNQDYRNFMTRMSQCLDVIRSLDSRGRASPLGRPRPVRHPVR